LEVRCLSSPDREEDHSFVFSFLPPQKRKPLLIFPFQVKRLLAPLPRLFPSMLFFSSRLREESLGKDSPQFVFSPFRAKKVATSPPDQ